MTRSRLTPKQREALYDAEAEKARAAGRGDYPICALCHLPIGPGQDWHDNHDKYLPHALGGQRDGVSHARCNLNHNHTHDTPLVAKVKRIRRKHIRALVPRSRFACSKASPFKKKLTGAVVDRRTNRAYLVDARSPTDSGA